MSRECFHLACDYRSLVICCSLIGVGIIVILISLGDFLPQDLYQGGRGGRS